MAYSPKQRSPVKKQHKQRRQVFSTGNNKAVLNPQEYFLEFNSTIYRRKSSGNFCQKGSRIAGILKEHLIYFFDYPRFEFVIYLVLSLAKSEIRNLNVFVYPLVGHPISNQLISQSKGQLYTSFCFFFSLKLVLTTKINV